MIAEERCVLAVIDNLFDAAPITEAAQRLGVQIVVTRPEEARQALERVTPRLVVLDLAGADVASLLRHPRLAGIPTIGFYPHVDQSLRESALKAGLGRAFPRSAFFARLPALLGDPPATESRLPEAGGGC